MTFPQESRPSLVPLTGWDHLWLTKLVPAASIGIIGGTPNRQNTSRPPGRKRAGTMTAQELLQQISDFCRHAGLAESTFGRRAVNDGKLANRLRNGGRITTETVDRIMAFMNANRDADPGHRSVLAFPGPRSAAASPRMATAPTSLTSEPQRNFRFFDNRQKYLLFVTTCSEKWVIAQRVGMELANIHPRPPALRLFDAGMGDGTVLARTMRAMHSRFPTMPFYIVGKEISLEDVRLVLEKMPDRLFEHPAMVLVITNMLR